MSHRERNQPRAHSDDHENVKTVLEQISFEEVSPHSIEHEYYVSSSKDQTKSLLMAANTKEDYEWQLLIVRKAVSNPHLAEQGATAGPTNNQQLKPSKSDSNQPAESGFDQPNWPRQKKQTVKRKHKRVRSHEKVPGPPLSAHETAESSDSSEEVLDNVTIIKVRRTQSSGVLAVTHRRHQSAPRQLGVTKYRRLTDPGCDVHTEEDEHVTDARTGQGLDDGVNLSDPIALAAQQPRLIRVTNKAKKKTRHATQQVQKRKSREMDDDKSSSGSHYGSSDSDHERTVWELEESAVQGQGGKSELSHATLYSKHIEPILRHTQQLMSTLHLDDDDQDEIEITKFTVEHQHEHAINHSLNDEERCPAPDPIAMLCGDMLSNPDSPISPSTSDDEYEELDRAPTVNMTRAPPPRASKSNLLLTRSRAKLGSEHSQSSLSVNTNSNTNTSASDSSVAPGTRPQLHVNLASIRDHREASVSQGNFFLNTDRRSFNTNVRQAMYKSSKSLPKFQVKPAEPDQVPNVPQPVAVPGAVQVSQSVTTESNNSAQSPRQLKYTMSTPYLPSAQRLHPVHNNTHAAVSESGTMGPALTVHHSLASLSHPAVIPSPRRSAFVTPSRLTTPRPSLTDVHSYTSPSGPVNSNPNLVINFTAVSSSDTASSS